MSVHKKIQRFSSRSMNDGFVDMSTKPVRVDCRVYQTYTSATTAGTVTVTETDLSIPNLGSRAIAFADLYTYYRIIDVKVLAKPQASFVASGSYTPGNVTWMMGLPLAPKSSFSTAVSITQFVDFPHLSWIQDFGFQNIEIHVKSPELKRNMIEPWLKTTTTGVTDPEFIQMCLEVASQPNLALLTGATLETVIDVTLEFAGPMDPALNPKLHHHTVNSVPDVDKDRRENDLSPLPLVKSPSYSSFIKLKAPFPLTPDRPVKGRLQKDEKKA